MSIHSYRWIDAFQRKGYDVSLIADSRVWVDPEPINIPVYVLPTLNKTNIHRRLLPNFLSVTRILKKIKPDFVNLHSQLHYGPELILNRMPFILTSWGTEVLELPYSNPFQKALAKWIATSAHRITVDAECLKNIWKRLGVPENKIEVIPFGIETNLFHPDADGNGIRRKLSIKESDIAIISTRAFRDHYNIECLINAIPVIVKEHRSVKFIIKGTGPLESNLKNLARKLHVEEHIRFIEPVPYNEISKHLAAADIYVSTSYIDSTSVSLLEAMACGLPPVTTDIPGNREWIQNEINGLLYPPKDHKILADRIKQLVEDEHLRKQFGERSHRIILERAEWQKCVSKMERIYNELL